MKFLYVLVFVICANASVSLAQTKKIVTNPVVKPAVKAVSVNPLKNKKDSVSYALGVSIGNSLQSQNLANLNMILFQKGLNEALKKLKTGFTDQEASQCINQYLQEATAEKSKANKIKGEQFLAANAKRKGVVTLQDGLQYEIIKASTDSIKPKLTDKVKCHYHGTLIDGTVFDSSVDRGEPISFPLGGVIKGWQEALQLMPVGSKWKLFIPSDLAYGNNSPSPQIAAGSTLIFEVELLGIEK